MIRPLPQTPCLAFLCIAFLTGPTLNAQTASTKQRPPHYFTLTLLTGASLQLCHRTDGLFGVSFPYSVTDVSGVTTNGTFTAAPQRIYGATRINILPFECEIGRLHHFYTFGISFPLISGDLSGGLRSLIGYGHSWYLNGRGSHETDPLKKTWVFKTSLGLVYTWDLGLHSSGELGRIDNLDKTVHVPGYDSGPIFRTPGTRYSSGGTYNTQYLRVSYAQRELALSPALTLSRNPFKFKHSYQLSLGYTIPVADRAGIFFDQHDGNDHSHVLGSPLNITNSSMLATYNNHPVRSAPFRFGGPYISLAMAFAGHK